MTAIRIQRPEDTVNGVTRTSFVQSWMEAMGKYGATEEEANGVFDEFFFGTNDDDWREAISGVCNDIINRSNNGNP